MFNKALVLALTSVSVLAGCVQDPQNIGQLGTDNGTGGDAGTSRSTGISTDVSGATETDTASTTTGNSQTGPQVRIHLRATAEVFEHTDAWAGQTPRDYFTGIRSLTLIDSSGALADLEVFDYAPDYVVAGYNDGDDTVVAEVLAAELVAGVYDRARVGLSHITFTVDTTVHTAGIALAGEVAAFQVLSDNTAVGDETLDRGFWRYVFGYAGMEFPTGGENGAPVLEAPAGGPLGIAVEDGETAVYFPVTIVVEPALQNSVDIVLEVNTYQAFRWQDETSKGFTNLVFDAAPPSFEPIQALGVNTYRLLLE